MANPSRVSEPLSACSAGSHSQTCFLECLLHGNCKQALIFENACCALQADAREAGGAGGAEEERAREVEELVLALTAMDPAHRMAAADAGQLPFFVVLGHMLCPGGGVRECQLMLSEECAQGVVGVAEGMECECGVFVCRACTGALVKQERLGSEFFLEHTHGYRRKWSYKFARGGLLT